MIGRCAALLALPLAAAWGVSCASRSPEMPATAGVPSFGVYGARIQRPGGQDARFRLLLWAAHPDRLHAEILSPLGGPTWIVDAGAGRISLASVRERTAWTGTATEETLEGLLGVRAPLEALVRALLDGNSPGGAVRIRREPAGPDGTLPRRFEAATGTAALRLERRGSRRLAGPEPGSLGTATPPPGFAVESLEDLGLGVRLDLAGPPGARR